MSANYVCQITCGSGLGPNRFILISRIELKIKKILIREEHQNTFLNCDSLSRIILFLILIHFDSLSKPTNRIDSIWFVFVFISICDSISFYSFWFDLILIRRESRFTRESWFVFESKIKSNQKSKVGESWFTDCRVIVWFDFVSKANKS